MSCKTCARTAAEQEGASLFVEGVQVLTASRRRGRCGATAFALICRGEETVLIAEIDQCDLDCKITAYTARQLSCADTSQDR